MPKSRVRSVAAALLVAAGVLVFFAQSAVASPGAYRVLFLNAVSDGCEGDTGVQTQLAGQPGVAKVDGFDASASTPSVATLDAYDMVVAHSDCDAWADRTAVGNNLADYADHGGVVVEYAYSMHIDPGFSIGGRWASAGYSPLTPGDNVNNNVTLGSFDTTSPLMAGVNTLVSNCNTDSAVAPGATRVAQWNNGQEAVAFKGRAVAVSASVDDSSCQWSGDYARLTLNAMTTGTPPYGTVISKKKINRKQRSAKFKFAASGFVTGFECSLSRAKKGKKPKSKFKSCASPKRFQHLKGGKYTFKVRAANANGPDAQPAKNKFKI